MNSLVNSSTLLREKKYQFYTKYPKNEQDRTLPKLFSEATNTLKEKSDKDTTRIKANF